MVKDFHTAYGDLEQICALLMHGVPVMALTATATHGMMKNIALALGMYQCTVVKRGCNQENIYYEVQRMQNFAEEEFESRKNYLKVPLEEFLVEMQHLKRLFPFFEE